MRGPVASLLLALVALVGLLLLAALVVVAVLLARRQRPAPVPGPAKTGAGSRPGAGDPFAETHGTGGDPRALAPGDLVEYLGQRYHVRGSVRLREGGYRWSEHFLDDVDGRRRWLSVEEDPDLALCLWTEAAGSGLEPGPDTLTYDGRAYRRDESGRARFVTEGTTGLDPSGAVEYVDYVAAVPADGAPEELGFERFGDGAGWEVGLGERVPAGALTIYPGS